MTNQGVKVKVPNEAVSSIQILLACVFSFLIGALLCFYLMTLTQVNRLETTTAEQQKATIKLLKVIDYYAKWSKLVDERFTEQDSNLTRLHWEVRVPLSPRPASEEYMDFLLKYRNGLDVLLEIE